MCTKRVISNYILLLFLLVVNTSIFAQLEPITKTDEYIITKHSFSVEDGLAARQVTSAIEDQEGFMWFGTTNGLCRYDGKSFKTFTKQNFGLLDNEIASLSIDEKNHLIITFHNKSINAIKKGTIQVVDLKNYTLQTLESTYRELPFTTQDVVWMANDVNKNMFFVTAMPFQLWRYTTAKGFKLVGELTAWNIDKKVEELEIFDITISSIIQNRSVLLKKLGHPSYLITEDTIIPFSNQREENIFSITKNKSFLIYNTTTNAVSESNFPDVENSFIKQNPKAYLHLYPVSEYLWWFTPQYADDFNIVFNLQKGIYLVDDKTFFLIAKPEELIRYTDLNLRLSCKDSRGNRWLCTNSGVIQISIKPNNFKSYFSRQQVIKPTYNQIRGIYAENSLDLQTNKETSTLYANVWQYLCVSKPTLNEEKISYATNNSAFNALLKHNNKLYIGGVDKIFEYDPAKKKSIEFGNVEENKGSNYMWSLTAVSNNILLAGSVDGLSMFNILTKKSNPLQYASSKIPKAKNVYRFVKTRAKGLVAVAENGLFLIDKNNMVVDYYGSLTKDTSHHLPITTIFDMYEDRKGICWIATNGEGLFRCDWQHSNRDKKIRVKQFTLGQGLPSLILYRIEEDSAANLWIGTYNGLLRFNTLTYLTSVYTTNDGVNNNEFNRTSSFKAADGTMYFGGLDGVIAFNPKQLIASETKKEPSFKLTSLTKYSAKEKKLIDGLISLKQDKKIVLQPEDSFLIIEFQLLDFKKRKHLYAYKLDGIDTQWNYIDENVIRLTGLPYGECKMHIKAQMANGQWSSNPILIPIAVLKPFYLETWFLLVVLLALGISIFGFFRYRHHKLIKEKHKLELKIANRTADLQTALLDRERLLIEIHHRVKNNLHVINGLLQLQKEELVDPTHKAAFAEGQSRIESIALIHQNLYKKDNLASIEFHSFIYDLSSKVANLYDTLNNPVAFAIPKKELFIDVDTAVPLGLIVNELLTNSYKNFDVKKRNRTISIEIKILGKGQYELLYKDNGSGLPKDVDFDTNKTLGLKLIKGLAKQLSGNASYHYDKECVFTIFFQDSAIRYNS